MTEWISVKDKLPSNNELILFLCSEDKKIYSGFFYTSENGEIGFERHRMGWEQESLSLESVSHWMPLPEVPK